MAVKTCIFVITEIVNIGFVKHFSAVMEILNTKLAEHFSVMARRGVHCYKKVAGFVKHTSS
jgi:hypothetical protein